MGAFLNVTRVSFLYIFGIGFVGGVASVSFEETFWFPFLSAIFAASFIFLFFFLGKRTIFLGLFLFFFALALGGGRFYAAEQSLHREIVEPFIGKTVVVRGFVVREPDIRENVTQLTIQTSFLGDGEKEIVPTDIKLLAVAPRYPEFSYGEELFLEGKLERPGIIESDTGRRFDYGAYLAKEGVVARIPFPKILPTGEKEGWWIISSLLAFKQTFLSHVREVVREPESSLLAGLLVGAKQSLGKELLQTFRESGLIHIVVLSGYNLTLVADGVRILLERVFRGRWPLYGSVVGIIAFAIMVGGSATVVRASVMALLGLLAKATGRRQDVGRLLFVTGFGMVLFHPHILLFDPSFQLSFLATAGLIYLSPFFEKWFWFVPKRFGFKELTSATCATQVAVLPLLLYQTGMLSLVSLPANFLVLPTVAPTMLLGGLSGLLAFIHPYVALPLGFLTQLFLSYQLFISTAIAGLPFASVAVGAFPVMLVWVSYLCMMGWVLYLYKTKTSVGARMPS